jgi:hypothetical protein
MRLKSIVFPAVIFSLIAAAPVSAQLTKVRFSVSAGFDRRSAVQDRQR